MNIQQEKNVLLDTWQRVLFGANYNRLVFFLLLEVTRYILYDDKWHFSFIRTGYILFSQSAISCNASHPPTQLIGKFYNSGSQSNIWHYQTDSKVYLECQ